MTPERTAFEIRRLEPPDAWDIYVGEQTPADFLAGYPHEGGPGDDEVAAYAACRDYVNGSPLCAGLDRDARNDLCDKLYAYLTIPE